MTYGKIRTLYCTCCGEPYRGRQFWNQDTGHGLGGCCWDYVESRMDKHDPDQLTMEQTYGIRGVHCDLRRRLTMAFLRLHDSLRRYDDAHLFDSAASWVQAMDASRMVQHDREACPAHWQNQAAEIRREIARARQFGPFIPPYMRQRPTGQWFNSNWEA